MPTFSGTLSTGPKTAGHVPTATEMTTWYDTDNALVSAWNAYTPVWTTTGTAPVLGNGTLVGSYIQVGKYITARATLTLGTTTTIGTGTWVITVPVTAVDANQIGSVLIWDQSIGTGRIPGAAVFNTTSNLTFYPSGGGGVLTNTNPALSGGWTSTDKLMFVITYEAA